MIFSQCKRAPHRLSPKRNKDAALASSTDEEIKFKPAPPADPCAASSPRFGAALRGQLGGVPGDPRGLPRSGLAGAPGAERSRCPGGAAFPVPAGSSRCPGPRLPPAGGSGQGRGTPLRTADSSGLSSLPPDRVHHRDAAYSGKAPDPRGAAPVTCQVLLC